MDPATGHFLLTRWQHSARQREAFSNSPVSTFPPAWAWLCLLSSKNLSSLQHTVSLKRGWTRAASRATTTTCCIPSRFGTLSTSSARPPQHERLEIAGYDCGYSVAELVALRKEGGGVAGAADTLKTLAREIIARGVASDEDEDDAQ